MKMPNETHQYAASANSQTTTAGTGQPEKNQAKLLSRSLFFSVVTSVCLKTHVLLLPSPRAEPLAVLRVNRPDRAEIKGKKRILFSQRDRTPRTYSQINPIQRKAKQSSSSLEKT